MQLRVEALLVLAAAAGVGTATGLLLPRSNGADAAVGPVLGCTVTDGDTLHCGQERVRLLGIDAADDPRNSRCRPYPKPGAICDAVKAAASKAALQGAVGKITPLRIERVGRDRFGRTLGLVYAGRVNLSCTQLRSGQAIYRADWDNDGRVSRDCPAEAR